MYMNIFFLLNKLKKIKLDFIAQSKINMKKKYEEEEEIKKKNFFYFISELNNFFVNAICMTRLLRFSLFILFHIFLAFC
jgi:hypothetical protein